MIEWARSPWGQDIPIHVSFFLMWVFGIAALAFFIVHAIYVRYFAKHEHEAPIPADIVARTPARIAKYSGAARAFHWVMALAMFALLFTAFLPKVGVQFPWVTWHWIAGLVLTASIIFHIIHASFFMDFWSIWPDRIDIEDAIRRFKRATGESAPAPRKFGKYPLENKGYHGIILLTGLAVTLTGVFMMKRVHTPFFVRNPYLFSDMTWGLMYVLHGLAGVGLIGLVMVHVYFAVRPEKLVQTKAMIFGTIPREHYLEHHDPTRWAAAGREVHGSRRLMFETLEDRCDAIEECYEFMLAYAAQGLPSDKGNNTGSQLRVLLQRAVDALSGIGAAYGKTIRSEGIRPVDKFDAFLAVLERDANDALAAVELVLAQPAMSSQLIDNLNASIHLRALLTDLFLIDEVMKLQRSAANPATAN